MSHFGKPHNKPGSARSSDIVRAVAAMQTAMEDAFSDLKDVGGVLQSVVGNLEDIATALREGNEAVLEELRELRAEIQVDREPGEHGGVGNTDRGVVLTP